VNQTGLNHLKNQTSLNKNGTLIAKSGSTSKLSVDHQTTFIEAKD
jgi:hypothetical protein